MSRHVTFNAFFVAQEQGYAEGCNIQSSECVYHYWNAKALHMLNFVQIFVMSCKTLVMHGNQVHREVYCLECVVSRAFSTG